MHARRNACRRWMLPVLMLLGGVGAGAASIAWAGETRFATVGSITLELSAVEVVAGGVLIADDELVGSVLFVGRDDLESASGPMRASLVKLDRARKLSEPHSRLPRLFAVQDVEGIAASPEKSWVYVVGSHAPTDGKGHRRSDREFLIKARWDPEERELRVPAAKDGGVAGIYRRLIDALAPGLDASGPAGFNVEGLALRGKSLYIGLRAPLSNGETGNALVFSAGEKALFGKDSERFAGPFERLELDLRGGGVRGLHFDEPTGRLLVLSGPSADGGDTPRALWSYDFDRRSLVLEHQFGAEQVAEHGNPEGITRFDEDHLLIAFDTDRATRASLMLMPWKGPR